MRISRNAPLLLAFALASLAMCPTASMGNPRAGIGPEEAISIQKLVDNAYHAHKNYARIPPGVYKIIPPAQGPHLQFHDLSHFAIDARNVTLLLTDRTRGGIQFRNCNDVSFRGATIQYEIPPFTQGTVENIAPDGGWYDIRIDKGYPTDFDNPTYFSGETVGYLFDRKTRWWKTGTYDLVWTRLRRLGPDLFRVFWDTPSGPDRHPVAVGDLMAFRGKGENNLTILDSSDMQIGNVTIYNAGAFAIWEHGGAGGNHYAVTVKRGPRPKDAITDPLLSSTADAIHSADVRKGPTVENSYLESMADDGIAIHGTFSIVLKSEGDQLVISKSTFAPGDPIRIYNPDGRPAGEARVLNVAELPGYENERKSIRTTQFDDTRGPYFTIRVDRPLRAGFDYLAENPAASGAGYVLKNNTIFNHRARGMLLKAPDGLVEQNTIDGSTMGGIVLTPEIWWNEAGYSRNVTVRNNTIRHVAYATVPDQLGGVVIAAINGPVPVPGFGNQHIKIEGNTFEDINGVNLLITSSEDVLVRGNSFIHSQHSEVRADTGWGEDPGALIFVTESRDVHFEENEALDLGSFNRVLVEATPTAQIDGMKTGVVIEK
jgi:hypothetical protein